MSIRMRHTRGHSGNRRSHHALKSIRIIKDATSGALRLPHRLDETTGMYRGKLIATPKVKKAKGEHKHDHAHVEKVEKKVEKKEKGSKGIVGKITGGAKPKARSGAGGGGA